MSFIGTLWVTFFKLKNVFMRTPAMEMIPRNLQWKRKRITRRCLIWSSQIMTLTTAQGNPKKTQLKLALTKNYKKYLVQQERVCPNQNKKITWQEYMWNQCRVFTPKRKIIKLETTKEKTRESKKILYNSKKELWTGKTFVKLSYRLNKPKMKK